MLDVRTVPASHAVGQSLMETLEEEQRNLHARSRQQQGVQQQKEPTGAAAGAAAAAAEGAEGTGAERTEYLVQWKALSYIHCR